MPVKLARGKSDAILKTIVELMKKYESDHPGSVIDLYRQNSASIRIRIVDPRFRDMSRLDRNTSVWDYLKTLPDDARQDITMLVLLDESEKARSMANMEFDDPVPSRL